MKVKIMDIVYNSSDTPIMLILTKGEKDLIANMGDLKKFLSYPSDMTPEEATEFMKIEKRKKFKK